MSRLETLDDPILDRAARGGGHSGVTPWDHGMVCVHCRHPLECVDQHRRLGTWLGSFICPNCRSEYFYTYRWGHLVPKV